MTRSRLTLAILGLSLSSAWGNGHATTYRALVRGLRARGHHVTFLERDVRWYAGINRDLPSPDFCDLIFYDDISDLKRRCEHIIRDADAVIVGSFVPEGVAVGHWVREAAQGPIFFYDIDTPVTLAKLDRGDHEYLSPDLVPHYDMYLSFADGPVLARLEEDYGARQVVPFYCGVDVTQYRHERVPKVWDLSYLGTYSADRQDNLRALLIDVAERMPSRRFVVAGAQYPSDIRWPSNVEYIDHLPPERHPGFYNASRFTLNITRADMVRSGWAPSVRLFEAAACATPVISDSWPGLDAFFVPGEEILTVRDGRDVEKLLTGLDDETRCDVGHRARERIVAEHSGEHRATTIESYVLDLIAARRRQSGTAAVTG